MLEFLGMIGMARDFARGLQECRNLLQEDPLTS